MIFRDNKIYNDYDKYDIIHWFKCLSNKQWKMASKLQPVSS